MRFRYRKLTSSFDAKAYQGVIADARAESRARYEALRELGLRPRYEGSDAELAAITGLVTAPRKVDVDENEADQAEIRQLIRGGTLDARDLVCGADGVWTTLAQHPSFYDLFDEDDAHGHGIPWTPLVIIGALVILGLLWLSS